MATTLDELILSARLVGRMTASGDLSRAQEAIDIILPILGQRFTHGVGADQAHRVFSDRRTLAATSETLNLINGSLIDLLGNTFVSSRMRVIAVYNRNTDPAHTLNMGGDFWGNWITTWVAGTDVMPIYAGSLFLMTCPKVVSGLPWSVVGPGNDEITFNAGTATITYDLVLVGLNDT